MIISRAIGPVPVDIIEKETLESTLKVTKLPVEFGADITDHAYREPRRIVLEGVIGGSLTRSSTGRVEAVAGWQALKQLQESRIPFTLISGLDVHQNILIEKLTADRDKDWSRVLKFTAECTEIIIVSSAYVNGIGQNAPDGGQAKGMDSSKLASGDATLKGSPDVIRGDTASAAASTSATTAAGRANSSILADVLGI